MKFVEYSGCFITKFNIDKIKKLKNTYEFEDGVISRTKTTTYRFLDDGRTILVDIVSKDLSQEGIDHAFNMCKSLSTGSVFKKVDIFYIMEEDISLGDGGPELLHWKLSCKKCEDMTAVMYEPELHPALIINFSKIGYTEVTGYVFSEGVIRYVCRVSDDRPCQSVMNLSIQNVSAIESSMECSKKASIVLSGLMK